MSTHTNLQNHEHAAASPWKRFWERGGWWKAVILAIVYYGVYQLYVLLVGAIFPKGGEVRGEANSAMDVFLGTGLPVILGTITLFVLALSIGWLKELFGPQAIRGRGWMWIGIAVVLLINVSALISIDYGAAGIPLVGAWLFTGLFVGFAEEVLTRGFAVTLMRKAGHGEIAVALVSSAIFGALHAGNFFTSDQGLATTVLQVVYTFFFGMIMYLALRLTGNLIGPILLHASTDPTVFLFSEFHTDSPLGAVVALGNNLVILVGIILTIVLIVSERRRAKHLLTTRPTATPA